MKQRLTSLLLCAIMVLSLSGGMVSAQAVKKAAPKETVIAYDGLGAQIKKGNIQLNQARGSLATLQSSISAADKAGDLIWAGYEQIGNTTQQLQDIISSPSADASVKQIAGAALVSLGMSSSGMSSIGTASLETQLRVLDLTVKKTEASLVRSAENLYLLYHQMDENLRQLAVSEASAEEQVATLKLQAAQGLVSKLALQKAERSLREVSSSRQKLLNQQENLLLQLQNLLGIKGILTLGDLPELNYDGIADIDLEQDLPIVESCYSARIKRAEWPETEQQYLTLARRRELTLIEQEAETNLIQQHQTLTESYDALLSAQDKLQTAQEDYDLGALKAKLGMLSKKSLETLERDLEAQQAAVRVAELTVFCAYEQYRSMADGLL